MADLRHHFVRRHRARISAAKGDDAERAAVVAAVLYLHESARMPVEAFDQAHRRFFSRHDVADGDLLLGAEAAPDRSVQFFFIAQDVIDLGHFGEYLGFGLRRATGDDDARIRLRA